MTENPNDLEHQDDEDVQNDEVIGQALRKSLIAAMLLGIPVIGVLIYLNVVKKQEQRKEVKEVIVPTIRDIEEDKIPELTLADVTSDSGIDFVHDTGRYGAVLLPETMGSGVAVIDYNGDGNLDLFFVNSTSWPWAEKQSGSTCKLYAGNGDMTFQDVSIEAGITDSLYGMGAAVGDYDNDGDPDLFISAVGKNRMLRNDDGKFVDVTDLAGVGGAEDQWGTSCGFVDYNNDGLLDLFVCSYVTWSKEKDETQFYTLDGESRAYGPPNAFGGSFSYLYRNDGEGKFTDVSAEAGINVRNEITDVPLGKGMGVAFIDVNRDDWMDIVVANDTVRNFLFINQKDGNFVESGEVYSIAYDRSGAARGAMGTDAVYYRGKTIAIGIGNFANEPSALYMVRPGRTEFVDRAMYTGLGPPTRQGLTFGLFFLDIDLDGRLDMLGANGHLEEEIEKTQRTQRYEQAPQLFWNAGPDAKSELVLVSEQCVGKSFCEPIVGRGAAYGDFDGDGDQDVVISVSNGKPRLFRNDQMTGHRWLKIKLVGTTCNRDAIGAVVTVKLGDEEISRRLMPTRSYLSQCEPVVTFGLGESEQVSEVDVQWPGGDTETFTIGKSNETVTLSQTP